MNTNSLNNDLENLSKKKKTALELIKQHPALTLIKIFKMDFKEIWRRIIIDGSYCGTDKTVFLENTISRFQDKKDPLANALTELLMAHQNVFNNIQNQDLMIRCALDSAFTPFGKYMNLKEAIADMTEGNNAKVQAYKTLFETGENIRGYIHKLECHAQAIEFIYAVTDIVYGLMLPNDLDFDPQKVTAAPNKVQLFYIKAGEVVALNPYVLHSGSLSVEPDRNFTVIIYKKPAEDSDKTSINLNTEWINWEKCLKIKGADKFYLTLDEYHIGELKTNCGYIESKKPVRLPIW